MASRNAGSVAPYELTRHIPVYRVMGTVMFLLGVGGCYLLASGTQFWHYPILGMVSVLMLALACGGSLTMWLAKPTVSQYGDKCAREGMWHELVYVDKSSGRVVTTQEEFDALKTTDIAVWRYIGSSVVMASGLCIVVSIILGIIALGYLNNPI